MLTEITLFSSGFPSSILSTPEESEFKPLCSSKLHSSIERVSRTKLRAPPAEEDVNPLNIELDRLTF